MLAALLAVAGANAADCDPGSPKQAAQAQQKITLLEKLTGDSVPRRRLQQKGDAAALATLENAVAILASSQQALADGCGADAVALANEALRLATEAFRSSPTPARDAQAEFQREFEQTRAYLASLEGRPVEETGLDEETVAGINRQVRNAESLAASGSVAEARELLAPVNDRLQRRLLEIFDQRTIYYENEFATPADEYAYLRKQYEGYMMLMQSGERAIPYSARQRVASLLERAAEAATTAKGHEAAGEWYQANDAMNAALQYCDHATRAMGYSY